MMNKGIFSAYHTVLYYNELSGQDLSGLMTRVVDTTNWLSICGEHFVITVDDSYVLVHYMRIANTDTYIVYMPTNVDEETGERVKKLFVWSNNREKVFVEFIRSDTTKVVLNRISTNIAPMVNYLLLLESFKLDRIRSIEGFKDKERDSVLCNTNK